MIDEWGDDVLAHAATQRVKQLEAELEVAEPEVAYYIWLQLTELEQQIENFF